MSNEYKYELLRQIQKRTEKAIIKDLDVRLVYTGHSLIIRSIEQIQYDAYTYTLEEVDRASKLKLLMG